MVAQMLFVNTTLGNIIKLVRSMKTEMSSIQSKGTDIPRPDETKPAQVYTLLLQILCNKNKCGGA